MYNACQHMFFLISSAADELIFDSSEICSKWIIQYNDLFNCKTMCQFLDDSNSRLIVVASSSFGDRSYNALCSKHFDFFCDWWFINLNSFWQDFVHIIKIKYISVSEICIHVQQSVWVLGTQFLCKIVSFIIPSYYHTK